MTNITLWFLDFLPNLTSEKSLVPVLTLFLPDLVTWRSYMGWFCPWPVGIAAAKAFPCLYLIHREGHLKSSIFLFLISGYLNLFFFFWLHGRLKEKLTFFIKISLSGIGFDIRKYWCNVVKSFSKITADFLDYWINLQKRIISLTGPP